MDFDVDTADLLNIENTELTELLTQVYVEGGFTDPDEAVSLFDPSAVRKRGILIGAREKQHSKLAGIVIIVPPDSSARRLAQNNEAEMHLLAVKPEYRRQGLGRMLIESAIGRAKCCGYSRIILWTQNSMQSAQKLYEALGFIHVDNIKRNGRDFKVYAMAFSA